MELRVYMFLFAFIIFVGAAKSSDDFSVSEDEANGFLSFYIELFYFNLLNKIFLKLTIQKRDGLILRKNTIKFLSRKKRFVKK
jgi:hypothetical protein